VNNISLSFLLNGAAVAKTVPSDARLLDVLRYDCGLPGTKEGCGEGECGACTVLLDELPVNSCLVPAFHAEGRRVETVESTPPEWLPLMNATGTSQCGACTPGIVMSIRWLAEHPEVARTANLREFMSGNLCRCTGYDGVISGAEAVLAHVSEIDGIRSEPGRPRPGHTGEHADAWTDRREDTPTLIEDTADTDFRILRPATVDEALGLLDAEGERIRIIAGGTDLLVSWHHHDKKGHAYLDLTVLAPELQFMRWSDSHLELGALATYWDTLNSPEVKREFPLLADAARQVGAMQIQTRGTWAGNIANGSPAADGVPVLMAYDAAVVLDSRRGLEEVPLDRYYTGYRKSVRRPDQLITAIRIPRRPHTFQWFHKVGARAAQAITKVGVAMVGDDGGWRVVANSVAPTVRRCPNLEAALNARTAFNSPDDVQRIIANDIAPIDDLRSTAAYRLNVLSRLIYYRLATH